VVGPQQGYTLAIESEFEFMAPVVTEADPIAL
jgi:hypothetical protein